jgi:hypothetical protein
MRRHSFLGLGTPSSLIGFSNRVRRLQSSLARFALGQVRLWFKIGASVSVHQLIGMPITVSLSIKLEGIYLQVLLADTYKDILLIPFLRIPEVIEYMCRSV